MAFNHFSIKRQAHHLSRQDTSTFNPFAHFVWGGPPRRADTGWEGPGGRHTTALSDLEAQRGDDDDVRAPPIAHAATSPAYMGSQIPHDMLQDSPGLSKGDGDGDGVRNRRARASSIPQPLGILEPEEPTEERKRPERRLEDEVLRPETPPDRRPEKRFLRRVVPKEPFTVANQIERIFLAAWINALLIFSPVGFVLNYTRPKSIETFVVNMLAAVPLLFLNDDALEEIAMRVGDTFGGLIYIFTANLVQLITCVVLITSAQGHLVQFAVAGSILANILFILGISIVLGACRRAEQFFNQAVAHVSANMLSLAATSLLIPTASNLLQQATAENLEKQSRGAAFILIIVYVLYLLFQLYTHPHIFREDSKKVPVKPFGSQITSDAIKHGLVRPGGLIAHGYTNATDMRFSSVLRDGVVLEEDEPEEPRLHLAVAVALFAATTTLLYFCIDFTVSSIDALTTTHGVSGTFVGLILLPLPNCDLAPILSAFRDKLDTTMNCTIGKCLQTALLVTPLSVLIAWGAGVEDVTLVFDGFEVVSLFAAILLLNFLVSDGKVTWIQGMLLLADWGLIAIAAFYATT